MNNLDRTELMKMTSTRMPNSHYRAMLAYIAPKCYVEVFSPHQSGEVTKVMCNKYGIPVCAEINAGSGGKDYVALSHVNLFEPYNEYPLCVSEYEDETYTDESLSKAGYVWDDGTGVYYNPETGDSIYW